MAIWALVPRQSTTDKWARVSPLNKLEGNQCILNLDFGFGLIKVLFCFSSDSEHRFELAIQLGDLKIAYEIASEAQSEEKWKQLAELATAKSQFSLAQECLHRAQDFGGLLLLATSSGNAEMVSKLGQTASESGKNNVAFLSHFILGDLEKCLDVLIESGRLPEAAFFARTYLPSQISKVLPSWKETLTKVSEKAGQSLADPNEYKNLFPNFNKSLEAEQVLAKERRRKMPANMFKSVPDNCERSPLDELEETLDDEEEFSSPLPEQVEEVKKVPTSPTPAKKAPPIVEPQV